MALTTASSKLRSTILFNSKDEQVLFKRSSADLAAARGLTPSALLARLPMEQLTSSDLGRWAAQLIYAEDGSCLDAFEGMFEDWSAIQPENDCRDVIKGFFDYCHEARICIDTTSERVHHLRTNWDSICLIMEEAAKMPECNLDARIQAKTGRELETTRRTAPIHQMPAIRTHGADDRLHHAHIPPRTQKRRGPGALLGRLRPRGDGNQNRPPVHQ